MSNIYRFTASLISVCLVGSLLIIGKSLIIPLVIALFLWNLLNTFTVAMENIPRVGMYLPYWLRMFFSLCGVAVLIMILISIVDNNINEVTLASSRYQENVVRIFSHVQQKYLTTILSSLESFLKSLDIQNVLISMYSVFSSIMSSAVLILLYLIFVFVEQRVFKQKLNAFFLREEHRQLVDAIIAEIAHDIQLYLGLKTLLGLMAALTTWLIMHFVGLDFAAFWALLIFFFSYIPNLGPIMATVFPSLLALIQFQTWWPFVLLTSGIIAVQFVIGNLIEPRFLGRSLNLSPLIILFALALWGSIWGILGLFLAVPITVILLIIFSHFNATRPLAVILSQGGEIEGK